MKNKFDLIVFDWDGTLVDSVDWIVQCLNKAAGEQGCAIPKEQDVKDIIGLSIHKALDKLFPELEQENRRQMISSYSDAFFSKQITEDDLFFGVDDMLLQFKQMGYLLAVATGKSRHGLDRAMQGTGLENFFNMTRCADETASKPSPKMLDEIIKQMNVSRERVVLVGDSTHDMEMAVNAGISSIAVLCGANSQEQLRQYKPLLHLRQTIELLEILKR
jgi:phosphoglycolate phosphatase